MYVDDVLKSLLKLLSIITEQNSVKKTGKIHSCSLIDQMFERFGMADCKPAKTPVLEGIVLSVNMKPIDEWEKSLLETTPYRQLFGCILHLANITRPDIAIAAGYPSRYMSQPGVAHCKAPTHVLNYFKSTRKLKVLYGKKKGSETTSLHVYSDSDFAGDVDERKSTSGHCFLFGAGVISWRSK